MLLMRLSTRSLCVFVSCVCLHGLTCSGLLMMENGNAGRVEYYYAEVDTWQTSHTDAVEVFYFGNGQIEAHHPSGMKEIVFANGAVRRAYSNGREEDLPRSQLSAAVRRSRPVAHLLVD
jgi:T-complex protein 10 C-terminus